MAGHFSIFRGYFWAGVLFSATFMLISEASAQRGESANGVILQETANSRGLFRQWQNQIQLDAARDRLRFLKVHGGTIFAVTDQGTVNAIDAESGSTLWAQKIGKPGLITQAPGVSDNYVGVTNGSTLYILNRHTGRILLDTRMVSAPATGPAVSKFRAYIPAADGIMYSYDLQPMEDPYKEFKLSDDKLTERERRERHLIQLDSLRLMKSDKPPLTLKTLGDVVSQPIISREELRRENVAWATDDNQLTMCDTPIEHAMVLDEKYNVPLEGKVLASLSCRPFDANNPQKTGILFVATKEGFVYGVEENTGFTLWRFPASEEIHSTPVYVDGELFVATLLSGMFCLDAVTGGDGNSPEAKWWSPRIRQFLACSKARVYTADHQNNLVILDRRSGQRISTLPIPNHTVRCVNEQTDRIYIATETGTVLCLRETALDKPLDFMVKMPEKKTKVEITGGKKTDVDEEEDDEDGKSGGGSDFGDDDDDDTPSGPKGGGDDDFGDDDDDSGGSGGGDDDAFGDDDF